MPVRKLVSGLLLWSTAQICWALAPGAEPPLITMLQGVSAQELADEVARAGGRTTHQLPIIDAVGAQLTREQLDSVLASGKITRYIDDLAVEDQPPTPATDDPGCEVAGAVAVSYLPDGLAWRLYNKRDQSVEISSLELDWPEYLGALSTLTLEGKPLTTAALQTTPQLHVPEHPEKIAAGKNSLLQLHFDNFPTGAPPSQSEFDITVGFTGGCEARLLPAYRENLNDYYYSEFSGAGALHRQGVRGEGVTVAVLDSGLWEHPALANNTHGMPRIPMRYDAISGAEVGEAFDESGHGTHLISALANSGESKRNGAPTGAYQGIAPDARIIPIKAFSKDGQGSLLDIVRGIQWVVDNRERYNIRILNLSFAARPRWPYFLDPINQAVMQAWSAGIVVIAAAGNEGPELMSVGSPGNTPYIITVGAVTDSWTPLDRSDDYIPDFSSRGPTPEAHIKPDIVAPGGHITGLVRPGSSLPLDHPEYLLEDNLLVLTGSSQSAAVVSGLTALLLQLEPDLGPDEVKCKLMSGADPAINRDGLLAYSPFVQGQGQINIIRSVLIGERACGNIGLDLPLDIAMKRHFEGPAIVDERGKITLPQMEQVLSPETANKGPSDTRVWGIKAHIERLDPNVPTPASPALQWELLYQQERQKVEQLSTEE